MADASAFRYSKTLPSASARNKGSVRFQTTSNKVVVSDGSNWKEIGRMARPQIVNLAQAATPATSTFFIATQPCRVIAVSYLHGTANTAQSYVQVKKQTGVQAPTAGVNLITDNTSSGFDCTGTVANTATYGTLTSTTENLLLAPGDRLSAVYSGAAIAELANVVISVELEVLAQTQTIISIPTIATGGETMFIAQVPCVVKAIKQVFSTAGTNASAVTVTVTKDTGTTAPTAGTTLLTAVSSLKGAINTVVTPALAATVGLLELMPGDRLAVKIAGTVTAVAGLVVAVELDGIPNDVCYVTKTDKAVAACVSQPLCIFTRQATALYESAVWSAVGPSTSVLTPEKTTGTTAAGSGNIIIGTANDLTATINTVVTGVMVTNSYAYFQSGDRISIKAGNISATPAGVHVTVGVRLMPIVATV